MSGQANMPAVRYMDFEHLQAVFQLKAIPIATTGAEMLAAINRYLLNPPAWKVTAGGKSWSVSPTRLMVGRRPGWPRPFAVTQQTVAYASSAGCGRGHAMKLLYLISKFPPPMIGGAAVYLFNIVAHLPPEQVAVCTPARPEQAEFDAAQGRPRSSRPSRRWMKTASCTWALTSRTRCGPGLTGSPR